MEAIKPVVSKQQPNGFKDGNENGPSVLQAKPPQVNHQQYDMKPKELPSTVSSRGRLQILIHFL